MTSEDKTEQTKNNQEQKTREIRKTVMVSGGDFNTDTVNVKFNLNGHGPSLTSFNVSLLPRREQRSQFISLHVSDFGTLQHLGAVLKELIATNENGVFGATSRHANSYNSQIIEISKFFKREENPAFYVFSLGDAVSIHTPEEHVMAILRDIETLTKNEKDIANEVYELYTVCEIDKDRLVRYRLGGIDLQ